MSMKDLLRLGPIAWQLRAIKHQLTRIADCMEADMKDRNILVHRQPPDPNEPAEMFVTNEEDDYVRELEEAIKQSEGKQVDRQEDV